MSRAHTEGDETDKSKTVLTLEERSNETRHESGTIKSIKLISTTLKAPLSMSKRIVPTKSAEETLEERSNETRHESGTIKSIKLMSK